MRRLKRFKVSKSHSQWTRPLSVAIRQASQSVHLNKSHIRTWLYYKNVRTTNWVNTAAPIIQYQSVDTVLNDCLDRDLVTAGNQSPLTFPSLVKNYSYWLADVYKIKMRVNMRNVFPTVNVQRFHFMLLSWFDFTPAAATLMNLIHGAAPAITPLNFKDRFKQVFSMQIREYSGSTNGVKFPKMEINRATSLRHLFALQKTDFQSPVPNPSSPTDMLQSYRFYGSGGASNASPVSFVYHHLVLVNFAALVDNASSGSSATGQNISDFTEDLAQYTTFYVPYSYAVPINQ